MRNIDTKREEIEQSLNQGEQIACALCKIRERDGIVTPRGECGLCKVTTLQWLFAETKEEI